MINIKQIREQLDKISPWPWTRLYTQECGENIFCKDRSKVINAWGNMIEFDVDDDWIFICESPQLVSDLCDEIERLQRKAKDE